MVHIRVVERLKAQETRALAAMGLSGSAAGAVFLTRVAAEQQLPGAVKVPNATTRSAMAEARAIGDARFATGGELVDELERKSRR